MAPPQLDFTGTDADAHHDADQELGMAHVAMTDRGADTSAQPFDRCGVWGHVGLWGARDRMEEAYGHGTYRAGGMGSSTN